MIGLISDIHGNYPALQEVLAALDQMKVSEIYCLGDVVGYFTQINECCEELRHRKIPSLLGNHDWYMAAGSFCPRSKSVNDCLRYQTEIITAENREWLAAQPVYRKAHNIFMVHGGWSDPIDEYLSPEKSYFERLPGRWFASGHNHVQTLADFGDQVYCNPGSVGQPRDHDPRAAFATFDGHTFSLHRVAYDIDEVGRLMDKAGFSGYYYGSLRTGARRLQWAEPEEKIKD